MTKLGTLDFNNFVMATHPETLERYFTSLSAENAPTGWATLNGQALEEFIEAAPNAELSAIVKQDFRRVSDLALRGTGLLFSSYDRFKVDFDHTSKPQELALRAFLDHREVWDYAWARFLLCALDSKVSVYQFPPCTPRYEEFQVSMFREALSGSYLKQAKGPECNVAAFPSEEGHIVFVKRGYYVRTASHWNSEAVDILSYRPALEDVLIFDPFSRQLTVKAPQIREREDYVRLFAAHFAGDMTLGEQALNTRTFDLTPIQNGTFNYNGDGRIVRVALVGIRLKLPFKSRGSLKIESDNVFESLKALNLSIELGELLAAKFRFFIAEGKDMRRVSFEVAPPSRTDLPESAYSSLINAYLRNQGVRNY